MLREFVMFVFLFLLMFQWFIAQIMKSVYSESFPDKKGIRVSFFGLSILLVIAVSLALLNVSDYSRFSSITLAILVLSVIVFNIVISVKSLKFLHQSKSNLFDKLLDTIILSSLFVLSIVIDTILGSDKLLIVRILTFDIFDTPMLLLVLLNLFVFAVIMYVFTIIVFCFEIFLKSRLDLTNRLKLIQKRFKKRNYIFALLGGVFLAFFHFAETTSLGDKQQIFDRTTEVMLVIAIALFVPLFYDEIKTSNKSDKINNI